jgi:hypothetical protein
MLDQILKALAGQNLADGRIVVNVNAPFVVNVGTQPADSDELPADTAILVLPLGPSPRDDQWAQAELDEKERYAANVAEGEKNQHPEKSGDGTFPPEVTDKLLGVIMSIPGNVTEEKLVTFAKSNGFTADNARSLFRMWGRDRFTEFLAERGVELKTGRGDGYLKGGLRKAAKLEDLQPGCVRNYGPKMHELHMAVAAHA